MWKVKTSGKESESSVFVDLFLKVSGVSWFMTSIKSRGAPDVENDGNTMDMKVLDRFESP
jgi:hypothetical protein